MGFRKRKHGSWELGAVPGNHWPTGLNQPWGQAAVEARNTALSPELLSDLHKSSTWSPRIAKDAKNDEKTGVKLLVLPTLTIEPLNLWWQFTNLEVANSRRLMALSRSDSFPKKAFVGVFRGLCISFGILNHSHKVQDPAISVLVVHDRSHPHQGQHLIKTKHPKGWEKRL